MEGIGKEVLVKCAGVPLVVKAMGSILALKETEIDWLDFKKYDLPRLSQDSEGTVLPILRFSYDYLSAPLKRCFVYCAIYPKDYEIKKEELIGMWVAHGLIQLDGTRRSIEDVGEHHFMDLLSRSFFEVHQNWMGTYYKMHDLIHDLAQSVGGDEYYKHESGAKCMSKSIRHAWVSGYELTNIGDDGQKLHTLVVTEPSDEKKVNELTSSTFQQLRVLRMRDLWLTSVPQFVGGLRHLYYLDLSRNDFVSLPESICSLYNLQTLILFDCRKLEELPAGTRDLGRLRRLDIDGCDKLRYMPRGLEELTCLQTLSDFVCLEEGGQRRKHAEVCELKSLVNLRGSLAITNLRGGVLANAKCETKRSCILVELTLITELKLRWKQYEEELKEEEEEAELLLIESLKPHPSLERLTIDTYPGRKFPSWMDRVNIGVSLPNIVSIQLNDCRRLRHLPALGLLPSLQKLYLQGNEGVENLIDSGSSLEEEAEEPLFPSLKELRLTRMYQLKRVVEPTESSGNTTNKKRYFPVLEKLEIEYCPLFLADGSNEDGKLFTSHLELSGGPKLRHMPRGLEEPTCLQTMNTFVTGGSGDEGGKRKCAEVCDLESQVSVIHTLDLSYTNIKSLPEFISEYVAVRELKLKGCQLLMELGPEIGEFLNLQELDLEGTEIICLPKEIAKLINLKSLKFTLCGYADQFQETKQIASVIPQKALSNLLQLNELCIDVNPLGDWWNAEVKAVIDDLHCLQELKILRLYIPTVDLFGYMIQRIKLLIDQDSVCFRFTVGHHERLVSRLPDGVLKEFDDLEKFKKGLKFTSGEGMSIEITNALQHMDAFLLERHWSINNLLEFGQKSTEKLKYCILSECNKLQTLIDTKQPPDYDGTVLGSLQHLSIHYMKNMQKIWRGPVKKGSLSNLKSLALYTCVSLATVFKIDMLANLTNLEELRIEDCPKIKTLASSNFSDSMSQDFLPKLKSMLLLELPNLRCISSGLPIAPKLERLVILFCPNLKKLSATEISSKDLQVLKGTKGWWDALKWYESDVTEADQNYLTSKFIPLREDGDLEEQFLRD